MIEADIRDKLVERGYALFHAPKEVIQFTKLEAADALLNDLCSHPHAFVLACVMDRQITAERAWLIPYSISQKLGGFSIDKLTRLSRNDVFDLLSQPTPLHRFVNTMSGLFHAGVQRIASHYEGNAALIWAGCPSSAEVVYRFLEFDGVGAKIATMAANILARDFKIEFADHFAIDISADRQVRRVFGRLGLCPPEAGVEQVIYKARALHPVFPGIMDLPCWEIGRKWCRAQNPDCSACYMNELCPTASAATAPKRSQLMRETATLKREKFMTAIPDGIAREHVLEAMSRIGPDPAMWPDRSESREWDIIDPRNGTRLPPKLVLSFAAEIATGRTLSRRDFSGGPETNDRLAQLGFTIVPKGAAC